MRGKKNEQTFVRRVGVVCGISSKPVSFVVVRSGGVWMMTLKDYLLMFAIGVMVVIATELFILAVTGFGLITR